jgi:hypothetical protein
MNGFLKAAANCIIMKCLHQRHSETLQMATSVFPKLFCNGTSGFQDNWHICFIEAALNKISKLFKDQEVKN